MRKAVIVGCNGQDGQLLYNLLLRKNYDIVGIGRGFIRSNTSYQFGCAVDIGNADEVFSLIGEFMPDEIYYLAAFHQSSEDEGMDTIELFRGSSQVNVLSLVNFLEGIRVLSPATRLFYAASSHIFKGTPSDMQDEITPVNPTCIYGITKASGLFTCRFYRNTYAVFASTGILYNHESSLRSDKFVSQKIIKGVVNIKNNRQEKLKLGDINAEVDWGYAPNYVEAMHNILNIGSPDDFVIATGQKHSVREFVRTAFDYLDLDWQRYVEEDPSIITKKKVALV